MQYFSLLHFRPEQTPEKTPKNILTAKKPKRPRRDPLLDVMTKKMKLDERRLALEEKKEERLQKQMEMQIKMFDRLTKRDAEESETDD